MWVSRPGVLHLCYVQHTTIRVARKFQRVNLNARAAATLATSSILVQLGALEIPLPAAQARGPTQPKPPVEQCVMSAPITQAIPIMAAPAHQTAD